MSDLPQEQTAHEQEKHVPPPEELLAEAEKTFPASPAPASGGQLQFEVAGTVPSGAQAAPFAFHQHMYVTEYIKLADQKAAVVFAVSTGLLCYLFKNDLHKLWLKAPVAWGVLDFLCLLGMIGLAMGLIFAAMVVVPRLPKTHRGLVFFGSVKEFESATAYASEVLSSAQPLLTRAILKHTYDLSRVCAAKYSRLTVAIWGTCAGVALSIIVLLVK